MSKRCVNCGINLDTVKCATLEHISNSLVKKLEGWLKLSIILSRANTHICVRCLQNLAIKKKRGNLSRNICLGCGAPVHKDSTVVTGDKLQVVRSWAPEDIAVDHLDKVCKSCYSKLLYSDNCTYELEKTIKEETVFVGVEVEPENASEENIHIKLESESSIYDDSLPTNENTDDIMSDHNNIDNSAITSNDDEQSSDEELVSISSIKREPSCINYEFLEESPETSESLPPKMKPQKYKQMESDSDEDYVPPSHFNISKNKPTTGATTTVTTPNQITIELENYKRTSRIGHCIFDDCTEDCVSLIPKTVRRKMVMEYNIYIPRLSQVCKEHLQDQNWEDLSLGNTTAHFTADHCQDLKFIATEACHTNFDFENIDTVDSKLVRYWFDLNKGDFNRIFSYFPKLKRLKEPKTTFAVYLMHLQKTSVKRIALLLKMEDKAVKRRITFVRDIVKCNNFRTFKDKFLEDD